MQDPEGMLPPGGQRFIDTVLEMLDEGHSLRALNLRQIARRAGCTHNNAYNYFASVEDLFWQSLKEALRRMIGEAEKEEQAAGEGDLMEAYINFAFRHPAWYRLIWLEPLQGPPPAGVSRFMKEPPRLYTDWLCAATGYPAGSRPIREGGALLHGFVHGELSAYVSGRLPVRKEEAKERIRNRTRDLFRILYPHTDSRLSMDQAQGGLS